MKISSKFAGKTLLLSAMFSIFCTANAEESEYENNISDYSITMRILEDATKDDGVFEIFGFSLQFTTGKLKWNETINNHIENAKKNRINTKRIDILNRIVKEINEQAGNNFEDIDTAMENIMNFSMENEKDLFYPVATYNILEYFLDKHKKMFQDDESKQKSRKRAKINLKEFEDKIIEEIKKRYEDDELKILVEEYSKVFPKKDLMINTAPPEKFKDVNEIFKKAVKSFWELDKYSAISEFELWGKNMLNVLIFDSEPMMVDEFKRQFNNYRKIFNVKQNDD